MAKRNSEMTSASDTYAQRASDIGKLLDLIKSELATHAAEATKRPRDWGFAGDLGRVRKDLADLYESLSGKEFQP